MVEEHESEYENHTVTREHSLRIILVNAKSLDFHTTIWECTYCEDWVTGPRLTQMNNMTLAKSLELCFPDL